MITKLLPCSKCSRHVRIGESRCPFCSAPFSSSGVEREARAIEPAILDVDAMARMGRIAVLAASATIGAAACDRRPPAQEPTRTEQVQRQEREPAEQQTAPPTDNTTVVPAYGAPPPPRPTPTPVEPNPATPNRVDDPAQPPTPPAPAYGGPPMPRPTPPRPTKRAEEPVPFPGPAAAYGGPPIESP